jgi:hypothetical protein
MMTSRSTSTRVECGRAEHEYSDSPGFFSVSIGGASAHSRLMDTAINYALWAIAALIAGGLLLAILVW